MIALTRTENTYGLNLTIEITFDGEYATSTVLFEDEVDDTLTERADNPSDILARTLQRVRSNAERAYLEYRAALLRGWAVSFTEPIPPSGRPSAFDRWMLSKMIARCPSFQVNWTPLTGTGLVARVLRNDQLAWVQVAPDACVRDARTIALSRVDLPAILSAINSLMQEHHAASAAD